MRDCLVFIWAARGFSLAALFLLGGCGGRASLSAGAAGELTGAGDSWLPARDQVAGVVVRVDNSGGFVLVELSPAAGPLEEDADYLAFNRTGETEAILRPARSSRDRIRAFLVLEGEPRPGLRVLKKTASASAAGTGAGTGQSK